MAKVLFVDVDGTLTETESGHTFKQHPQDVKVIDGADKAIAYFHNQGWRIIGISNQGGCGSINPTTGKPFKTIEDAVNEMQFTLSLFPKLELILFCPDLEGSRIVSVANGVWSEYQKSQLINITDSFRKPGIGMIQYIWNGNTEIEQIDECYLVGDRPEDEQAAINAGINFCPADMWRDRFRKGTFAHAATPEQIKFLEGIGITATGW